MAHVVGDERTAPPGAVGDGAPPVPTTHPADAAEDAARWAVEGKGIAPRTAAGAGSRSNQSTAGAPVPAPLDGQ